MSNRMELCNFHIAELKFGELLEKLNKIEAENKELRETKTGEWEYRYITDDDCKWTRRRWYCSACGGWNTYGTPNYCMNCGAKMMNAEKLRNDAYNKLIAGVK